jgi:co-chaperonin GroES (HSP10)
MYWRKTVSAEIPDKNVTEKEAEAAMAAKVDWDPTPGFILVKVLKREEVATLYDRAGGSNLSLPDSAGKVSDSVGVGRVVKNGTPSREELLQHIEIVKFSAEHKESKGLADLVEPMRTSTADWLKYKPGDYVAFMPYTDLIIEIDGTKYSLLPYSAIRGVRKG